MQKNTMENDKNRIVCCIMGQECQNFIGMSLESAKPADKIVYIDGGSSNEFWKVFDKTCNKLDIKPDILHYHYDQDDKTQNGRQRNHCLDFVKLNYPDYWAICIDADEVIDDFEKIRDFVDTAKEGVYSVKMRHFIGNLGTEDAKEKTHFALNRLFKIESVDRYPEVEHPVLVPREGSHVFWTDAFTIWHLGYISGMFDIQRKFMNHSKKSNMHTPQQLKEWHAEHLFGIYPTSKVMPLEIPRMILEKFGIDPEEVYFHTHKTLEIKHFIMVQEWNDMFKPKSVLDIGCGLGLYGYVFKYLGINWTGMEISKYAIKNKMQMLDIKQGDIRERQEFKDYDLVLVLDILEHLNEKELDDALTKIKNYGINFIFSLPYLGDPNLHLDKTHRIFKSKEWWVEQLSRHFKIKEVPDNWAFAHQLLLGVPR